jgi:CrcB protein
MRFVWVGLGGAVGSVARYAIGLVFKNSWATFGINLSGAFLLALFLTVALGQLPVAVITPIAVGVIGGFTTFSTFTWDAYTLSNSGQELMALIYVSASVLGGLLASCGGYMLGRLLRS